METLIKILIELIDNEIRKNKWSSFDKFYNIKNLSIDQRGRVGEYFFKDIFKKLKLFNEYIDNSHGDWDIVADNLKIEIKTATLDINNKFQHEGIKENKFWDVIAFLDISQNSFYITFIHKDEFEFGIERKDKNGNITKYGTVKVYNKKQNIHFRGKDNTNNRATGAGYKVDLKLEDLKKIENIDDIKKIFLEMKKRNNLL